MERNKEILSQHRIRH